MNGLNIGIHADIFDIFAYGVEGYSFYESLARAYLDAVVYFDALYNSKTPFGRPAGIKQGGASIIKSSEFHPLYIRSYICAIAKGAKVEDKDIIQLREDIKRSIGPISISWISSNET